MQQGGGAAEIEVSGNTLRVTGQPALALEEAFRLAVRRLLGTDHETLVVDLSGVPYIGSEYLGELAAMVVEAAQKQRSVSIRATGTVAKLLRLGELDKLGSVEVVGVTNGST